MSLIGKDCRYHRCIQRLTFPGVEEFKTEDEISNDINTLVTVEEQWTKLEQTVWKRRLANTRLALSWS